MTSCRQADQNARPLDESSRSGRCGSRIHSALPIRNQSQPISTATTRLAAPRATTISGCFGNAIAVAVSTIGLIAGAASRKARAAAGVTPRRISEPAIGTEPHSQPGSTTPATLATGTARAGFFGSARAQKEAGTNTAITADSTTPNTRNGTACTITETNTVIQVCNRGPEIKAAI